MFGDTKVAYKSISHPFFRRWWLASTTSTVSRLSRLSRLVLSPLCSRFHHARATLHLTLDSGLRLAVRSFVTTESDVVEKKRKKERKKRRKSRPSIRRNTYAISSSQTMYLEGKNHERLFSRDDPVGFYTPSAAAFNASCASRNSCS